MHGERKREREREIASECAVEYIFRFLAPNEPTPAARDTFSRSRFPQVIHGLKYLHTFEYERFESSFRSSVAQKYSCSCIYFVCCDFFTLRKRLGRFLLCRIIGTLLFLYIFQRCILY